MAWPRRAAIVAEARAVRPAGPAALGAPRGGTRRGRTGGQGGSVASADRRGGRPGRRDGAVERTPGCAPVDGRPREPGRLAADAEGSAPSRAAHPRGGDRQGARPVDPPPAADPVEGERRRAWPSTSSWSPPSWRPTTSTSALAHAETAVRRAGRVPAAREALGMVAYRQGDFARALTEFRTVRRLSGSSHLLPLMVDCERGLGRHGRALDLAATPEAAGLGRVRADRARDRRVRDPP